MKERLTIIDPKGLEKHLEKIPWRDFIDYGSVKIQVRDGKATFITMEKTVRMDTKL